MKKIIVLCLVSCVFIFSCEKEENTKTQLSKTNITQTELYHSVTTEEYQKADEFTKRLIDQVDASVNSLDILSKNKSTSNYEALIRISKDPNSKFSNSVTILPVEEEYKRSSANLRSTTGGSCHVCGVRSAYACLDQIKAYLDNHKLNDLDVHIHRENGCVDITY